MRRLAVPFLVLTLSFGAVSWSDLFSYVNTDDGAYKWEIESQSDLGLGVKLYDLKLTSQIWQGITWRHSLRVVVPPSYDRGAHPLAYSSDIDQDMGSGIRFLPWHPVTGGFDDMISRNSKLSWLLLGGMAFIEVMVWRPNA